MRIPLVTNLTNHVLLATEDLDDTEFEKSVIYICEHNEDGAMGVVINQPMKNINFKEITMGMDLDFIATAKNPIIFSGGPVEPNRGFVLHSSDYRDPSTLHVSKTIKLSSNSNIVTDIASGKGPAYINFCLGYAGWESGQLEDEITENCWIIAPANDDIIFRTRPTERYEAFVQGLGITHMNFTGDVGYA